MDVINRPLKWVLPKDKCECVLASQLNNLQINCYIYLYVTILVLLLYIFSLLIYYFLLMPAPRCNILAYFNIKVFLYL